MSHEYELSRWNMQDWAASHVSVQHIHFLQRSNMPARAICSGSRRQSDCVHVPGPIQGMPFHENPVKDNLQADLGMLTDIFHALLERTFSLCSGSVPKA